VTDCVNSDSRPQRFARDFDASLPQLIEDDQFGGDPVFRSLHAATLPPNIYYASSFPDNNFASDVAQHLGNRSDGRFDLIQGIARELPPMKPGCRLTVCIPVAAHEEGNNIRTALEAFKSQTAKPESWEIVLYLNHPFTDRSGNMIFPDETLAEVAAVQAENPHLNIHSFYLPIPIDLATIGQIRRILHDAVTLRHLNRDGGRDDHIMLRTDADIVSVCPPMVETYIENFDTHPLVAGITGGIDYSKHVLRSYPAMHFGGLVSEALTNSSVVRAGRACSAGANLAFRVSKYVEHRGFDVKTTMGEDIDFDQRLEARALDLRRYQPERAAAVEIGILRLKEGATITVSSRRAQKAYELGLTTIQQWSCGESAFDVLNASVRDRSDPETSPGPEVLSHSELPAQLELELNSTLPYYRTKGTIAEFRELAGIVADELDLVLEEFGRSMNGYPHLVIQNSGALIARLRRDLFETPESSSVPEALVDV
jgi:hypothetical protein